MIWLILGAMLLLLVIFVVSPLLREAELAPSAPGDDLDEVRTQLARLDADRAAGRIGEEAARESRRALDRRVLDVLNAKDRTAHVGASVETLRMARIIVPAILFFGAIGLYTTIGQPNFNKTAVYMADVQAADALRQQSLSDLVGTLQQKLSADPSPPAEGYLLLARSLMTLARYDEAFGAYEAALRLSDANPSVQEEFDRARVYVSAQSMSDEDRGQMIAGMVEGLAARLADDPNDAEGWMRLIRARAVMGEREQAASDLATAFAAFEADPETRAQIARLAAELGLSAPE